MNLYLVVQIDSRAQKWENGRRNTLQTVKFASSKGAAASQLLPMKCGVGET